MRMRRCVGRALLCAVLAGGMALGAAAVGMYLLVLRAEKFLNSVWGVRV